jgi:hypothetical protein
VVVTEAGADTGEEPKELTACTVTLYVNPAKRPEISAEFTARLPFVRYVEIFGVTVVPVVTLVTTILKEVA